MHLSPGSEPASYKHLEFDWEDIVVRLNVCKLHQSSLSLSLIPSLRQGYTTSREECGQMTSSILLVWASDIIVGPSTNIFLFCPILDFIVQFDSWWWMPLCNLTAHTQDHLCSHSFMFCIFGYICLPVRLQHGSFQMKINLSCDPEPDCSAIHYNRWTWV